MSIREVQIGDGFKVTGVKKPVIVVVDNIDHEGIFKSISVKLEGIKQDWMTLDRDGCFTFPYHAFLDHFEKVE